jgi:hypothetical protein
VLALLSLKDYVYLGIIIAVVSGLAWWHHEAVREGEQKVETAQAKAVVEQQAKDTKAAKETTDALNAEIAKIRAAALQPIPVVRLCVAPRSVPAPAIPGRAQPGEAASRGDVPSVPEGGGSGPDLGPTLQRLALAADLLSAQDRACLEFVKGVAK